MSLELQTGLVRCTIVVRLRKDRKLPVTTTVRLTMAEVIHWSKQTDTSRHAHAARYQDRTAQVAWNTLANRHSVTEGRSHHRQPNVSDHGAGTVDLTI